MRFRNHAYFRVGAEKLQDELDVVSIIKAIRQVKLMNKVLMNKHQNLLLKFQQKHVIDSTTESSEFEGTNTNIISLIQHKNQTVSNFYVDKIKRTIEEYKSKDLKLTDKKILKGILQVRGNNSDSFSSSDIEIDHLDPMLSNSKLDESNITNIRK